MPLSIYIKRFNIGGIVHLFSGKTGKTSEMKQKLRCIELFCAIQSKNAKD